MSSIMNIGVLALQANQAALQTVSNNIANVNTPGYSRRTVDFASVPPETPYGVGRGVDVAQRPTLGKLLGEGVGSDGARVARHEGVPGGSSMGRGRGGASSWSSCLSTSTARAESSAWSCR